MKYVIYIVENKLAGKCYIGKTRNLKQRMQLHWSQSRCWTRNKLSLAMREFGWMAFSVRILDTANSNAEASTKEKKLILEFKSNDPNYGYNILPIQ